MAQGRKKQETHLDTCVKGGQSGRKIARSVVIPDGQLGQF